MAESCALPLVDALRRHGVFEQLGARVIAALTAAQIEETQRVMAAKIVMRELDDIASSASTRVLVLKGAVRLAGSTDEPPIDLGDIDVLVTPEQAAPLWSTLVAHGWTPHAGITATDGRDLESNHYAPLYSPLHGFALEVHESLEYGMGEDFAPRIGRRALAGFSSLDRPAGVANILALLSHAVVKHPFRRGHLRDLVLIAGELRALSVDETRIVRSEIASSSHAPELTAMLEQCLALRDAQKLFDTPDTLRHVALKYLTTLGYGAWLNRIPGRIAYLHAALERPEIRRDFFSSELRHLAGIGATGTYFDRLRDRIRVPVVGFLVGWIGRLAFQGGLVGSVALLGWKVRGDVRMVLDGIASCGPSSSDAT